MLVLGIESSCDETSFAVVENGRRVLSNIVASQIKSHSPYGGVVPELASREHLKNVRPVFELAMKQAGLSVSDVDLFGVTQGPGLAGSLLVGIVFARALAYAARKKMVGVHHIEAHLYSPFLENPALKFPYVGLVVSGGHTSLYHVKGVGKYKLLGSTIDDAVGEAYDKVAKLLGLGYPGGPLIDKLAQKGNGAAIDFPRAMLREDHFNFSFSGVKTAVLYHLRGYDQLKKVPVEDVCASFQEAVADVLVEKTLRAARQCGVAQIAMAGGVACNSRLRERFRDAAAAAGLDFFYPSPALCTDNAAMIAGLAYHKRGGAKKAEAAALELEALPNWQI